DPIVRARELLFIVPCEVAHVEEFELAVPDQNPDALIVVRIGLRNLAVFPILARGVRTAALERLRDRFARRHDDFDIQVLNGNPIARLYDLALALGQLDVGLVLRGDVRPADLHRLAVIHVQIDRDHLGERLHRADVVTVEMRGEQHVDLLEPRFLRGRKDALGIAIVGSAIGGIDEQRLTARRDNQRGRAARGIDPIDLKIARRGTQGRGGDEYDRKFSHDDWEMISETGESRVLPETTAGLVVSRTKLKSFSGSIQARVP